jgi:cytochrome oxidase Cu insertion factor (SCO1/SenC/PrrC family)
MTQKRSQKARREEQEQAKKQRRLVIAGFAVMLILLVATFAVLRGQNPQTGSSAAEPSVAPEVGALAPDFQLASKDGELVKLSDFRGRPVAVTFMHTW